MRMAGLEQVLKVTSILAYVFTLSGFFRRRRRVTDRETPPTNDFDRDPAGDCEVYLSFSPTIRKRFIDVLYWRLRDAGIRTSLERSELGKGEELSPEILGAIQKSKVWILIFSKNYASSKRCLAEVTQMVKWIEDEDRAIFPIFYDVSHDDVQNQKGSFARAFVQHSRMSEPNEVQGWRNSLGEVTKSKGWNLKRMADVQNQKGSFARAFVQHSRMSEPNEVQGWRKSLGEVTKSKGWNLERMADGHEGKFIKMIVSEVLIVLKKAYRDIANRSIEADDHVGQVMDLLDVAMNDVRMVAIRGNSGVGKSTVARNVYTRLLEHFEGHSFLDEIREVSQQFKGLERLQGQLISDILKCNCPDYKSVDEGIHELSQRFRDKKVLIILDNVDEDGQLRALAADLHWFAPGSRVIVTTEEEEIFGEYELEGICKVEEMHPILAHRFFCDLAVPTPELMSLSYDMASVIGKLPLALEIIGSFLRGKGKKAWERILDQLKNIQDRDYRGKLKVIYHELDYDQQQIFLDTACFFVQMDERIAVYMWDDSDFYPQVGLEVLKSMSLVKIGEDHVIRMHGELRDLGRDIVRSDNYNQPGGRSRLWNSEEAISVMEELEGTDEIEAIRLSGRPGENVFSYEHFANLSNLRLLELHSTDLEGDFQGLLPKLRWLRWHDCPSTLRITNLNVKKLVILDLSYSRITEGWNGWSLMQSAVNLKVLDLTRCSQLVRTPNFSSFPILERLILEGCRSLTDIHPSMGQLKSLIYLDLRNCSSLAELPTLFRPSTEVLLDGTRFQEISLEEI